MMTMSATEAGQTGNGASQRGEDVRRGLYIFAGVLVLVALIVLALAFLVG